MIYTQPEPTTANKVRWTEIEIDLLGKSFVEERKLSPLGEIVPMFRKAQHALPEHRRRDIGSMSQVPDVVKRIEHHWLEFVAKSDPTPQIVHVETQQPPDYVDMLHRLDTPSLVAMLVTRIGNEWSVIRPALAAMSGRPETNSHGAPLVPPVSLLSAASAKPRRTRVLLVGPLKDQFQEILKRAETDKIPVDLQWLDKDKSGQGVPISTDYVILTRHITHKIEENLRAALPAGKFFYIEGGIGTVVNKLRDIGTLLPPRA